MLNQNLHMKKRRSALFILIVGPLLAGFLAFWIAEPASAHTRVEIGPYVLILGWAREPVIVGERNALTLQVSEDEAPVTGLEGTLQIAVLYAGRTFIGNLAPTEVLGLYRVEIFPTVRGQYEVHLTGSIGDLSIDEIIEPEEVLPGRVLQFPERQPDLGELEASVAAVERRAQTAMIIGVVGIIAGLAGVSLAVLSLRRASKR